MKTRLQMALLNACLVVAFMLTTAKLSAQVTLPGTSPYSENFNSTPGTSGTSYPTGWAAYNGTTVDNTMSVGNASSTSGGNYNFASRIGILGSGSSFVPSSLVLRIANTTGKTGLKISYNVVKIREQARSNSFNLEISTTSATSGFTAVAGGTYASGTIAEGTSTAYTNVSLSSVDNTAGNVWIRWSYTEISGSGSRDAIALDDVVLAWGAAAPLVTTSAANTITASSAQLNGTVNANGNTATTSFNWGLTTSYGSSVTAAPSPVTGTSATAISGTISSLLPDTQYNFRAVGTVSGTPTNGANASFYTLANVPGELIVGNPTISTLDVTVTNTTQNSNPAATKYAIREAAGNYVQANGSLGATAVWQTAAIWGTVTITGLDDDTLYSFAAKARNGAAVETALGSEVSGTTLLNTAPTLTAGSLAAFGPVCLNTPSASHSFTIDGINMTTADITVGPLAGYTFSATAMGTYTPTLTITPAAATVSETVYVIFEPTAVTSYDGNIAVEGGGAPAINIAALGSGINTLASVTTASATALTAATAAIEGNVTSEGCSETSRGIVYSTTTNPTIGGIGVTQLTDSATGTGTYTLPVSGLLGATTYYVKAYGENNGGVSYGGQLTFTTAAVIAPVATAATDVTYNSFTANWDASEGAASYRLDVSESATFGTAAPATDLFFSEYVEGSSTNKYLEIYNGTGAAIDLSDYRVKLYSNGSSTATGSSNDVQLSGTIADGATVVLKNSGATIYAGTATTVASVNFNGDDAVALYKISTASNVDIIGKIGEDPGTAWTSASNTTVDKTLVRKSSVSAGVTTNPASGFPTLETQWDVLDQNVVTNLGSHTFAGSTPSFVTGYEDLPVSGTSQAITGLAPETNYYYRVRGIAGNVSGNSNVITATTVANTEPTLSVTGLPEFGSVCVDAVGGPNQMTVSGINLTSADITVGPAVGFSFSETETGTYTNSLTLTQAGGTFSQEVFVRFEPTDAFPYNADIEIAGGGATEVFAVAVGEGINTTATAIMGAVSGISAYTADLDAEITVEGCSDVTERGILYSVNADPELGGINVSELVDIDAGTGIYTLTAIDLIGGTQYYARAYAINNGGVSYSESITFTTDPVAAPLATDATAVTVDGFTANWDASQGASSYRLDVSESATFGTAAPATDLFFSEYVEGSSTNKYLEIYNGTGAAIDLSDYRVKLYSNGSSTATGTSNDVQLSGTIADGATVVLKNSGATIYAGTATTVASVNFNGDDAVALYKISTASNVDIIGKIGEDPGTAWTSASNTTVDKTLVRKSSVTGGVTVNPTTGFATLETQWDVLDQNDVTNLGSHTFAGNTPSFVTGYEDLAVSGTSQAVTGLNPATTYYYRVRAVAGNVSGNSNTIAVTTDAPSPRMASSVNAPGSGNNDVAVYGKAGILNIHSSAAWLQSVVIYDVTGKQLFSADQINKNDMTVESLHASNEVLIVKILTADNKQLTKKIRF